MPALRTLGPPRIKIRRTYTFDTQDFLVLTTNRLNDRVDQWHGPRHPYNVQYTHYQGEAGWLQLEVRQGDRPYSDSTAVDRIGLDGWIDPMPNGDRTVHAKFEIVFEEGCLPTAAEAAAAPAVWLNFFEIHCKKLPGVTEFDGAGPLGMHVEWSYGSSLPIFRVWTRRLILDDYGRATGNVQTIAFQASAASNPAHQIVAGVKYLFEVDMFSSEDNGFIHIKMDGVTILDINNQPVGFGPERRQYPTIRMYRATKPATAKLKVHPITIAYPKVPNIPGVTRGQELVRDGQFNANMGVWTDIDSDPPAYVAWESDGAGGGFLRTHSPGFPDYPPARLKRRLDILEIGETYELKISGTLGLGAAPTDGGYFDPVTRYLAPTQPLTGDEIVRQFVSTSETIFLGTSNGSGPEGLTLDNVSLKRVIT